MDFYSPPNIKLPIQLHAMKASMAWPLATTASRFSMLLYSLGIAFFLVEFTIMDDAFVNFLYSNYGVEEPLVLLDSVCTFIIGIQVPARTVHCILTGKKFRKFLQHYYSAIYVDERHPSSQYVKRLLIPVHTASVLYYITMTAFALVPIIQNYFRLGDKFYPFPFKCEYRFDISKWYWFAFGYLITCFCGSHVVCFVAGETFLIESIMCNLMGRFLELKMDIESLCLPEEKKNGGRGEDPTYQEVKRKLNKILKQHAKLMQFADELSSTFSFRYFVTVLSQSLAMCLLVLKMFNMSASLEFITYICWLGAAVTEQLAMGYVASELIELSSSMTTIFYSSQWENIPANTKMSSGDKMALTKDILRAMIITANKPAKINALGYFDLSIVTSFNLIRTSYSYFMFLNTMKDVEPN